MTIWAWALLTVCAVIWALVGAVAFLMWALSDDDEGNHEGTNNLALMVIICGPIIWAFVGWLGVGHLRRNRGNKQY